MPASLGAYDRVGAARPNDWFSFTLANAATVDFRLSGITGGSAPEIALTDAGGALLAFDFGSASRDGSIVQALSAGFYRVEVLDGSAAGTTFALSAGLATISAGSVDGAHPTPAVARQLGVVDGATAATGLTLAATAGATDDTLFTIAAASHVAIRASGLSASLGLNLLDATGTVLVATNGSTSSDASIEADLAPGTYLLQASGTGAATNADLAVSASALPVVDGTADLGTLGAAAIRSGWVGPAHIEAAYGFTLQADDSVDARVSGLLAGATLTLRNAAGMVVATALGGPTDDASLIAALAAGSYTATVGAVGGSTGYVFSAGRYDGLVAAGGPDGFGATFGTATALGEIASAPQTLTGTVGGASADDYFSFTVAEPSRVSLDLGGLSQAASLFVADANGATLAAGFGSSGGDASVDVSLAAGTYFLDVHAAGVTGYSLLLEADAFGGAGGIDAASATNIGALTPFVAPPPPSSPPPLPVPASPVLPSPPPQYLSLAAGTFIANLDALAGQASRIGAITLTDGGAPAFALTAAQLAGDQDALRFIATPFSLAVTDGGYRASQAAVTAGGLGAVSGVTSIGFADGTLSFDASSRAASVLRLYQAGLGRAPDTLGLNYWVNSNRPLPDLAQAFLGSPEFAARYGAGLSDESFVTLLYRNVLGRVPDDVGNVFWNGALAAGASRATVLTGFSESPENVAGTSALVRAGIFTVDPAAPPIARLYDAVLGRAPDAYGLQAWDQRLDSGAMSLAQIATGFTGSAEFQAVFGGLDDADFVSTLYVHSLHRAPDAAGLAAWTSRLGSGALDRAGVVLGFSESAEHQANTQASIINADPNRAGVLLT